ncbi:hypothetical protein QUB11_10730 [Microcoleus sp. B6-A1]|uniref:hypothetical protein n=1 Tax=Microcoleus sp. B6-A1 TaxID=2818684 RepID=UPI002FD79E74
MQTTNLEKLSAADAQSILAYLPDRIRIALITRAAAIEYSIEAVVGRSHFMSFSQRAGYRSFWPENGYRRCQQIATELERKLPEFTQIEAEPNR